MSACAPRITIVIITADGIMRPCFEAVLAQSYPKERLELVVNCESPQHFNGNPLLNKYENCSRNREKARARALKTKADYFLFLDDDIVIPTNALESFTLQTGFSSTEEGFPKSPVEKKEVVGGYYPILGTKRFVCGRWVADNHFLNFEFITPGLVKTDTVGLGCAFVSRNVVEKVQFEPGTDLGCFCATTGRPMLVGECGVFGNRVADLGVTMYMCGDVVCQHLSRNMVAS